MTRYTVLVGNSAIWEGTTLESNYPNVRITIIGSEAGVPAFIIRILNAPKNYMIFPTDSENIYVALETRPYIE